MNNNTEMPAIGFGPDADYDTLEMMLTGLGDLTVHVYLADGTSFKGEYVKSDFDDTNFPEPTGIITFREIDESDHYISPPRTFPAGLIVRIDIL